MATFNDTCQWEFDAPKFYDFTKQESPNEQVESWFGKDKGRSSKDDLTDYMEIAKRAESFSRHIRHVSLSTSQRTKETATRIPRTDTNKPMKNDTASSRTTAASKKRVDIFDALASTPTIASAAKRSNQQLSATSSKPDTTSTIEMSLKKQSSSTLPSRVPRLPSRISTQRTHLQSKDNETNIDNNQQEEQSIEKDNEKDELNDKQQQQQQQQSATMDKENDGRNDKQQQQQRRISTDENVPPPTSSISSHTSNNNPMTAMEAENDRISLSLTDFNAIFNRVEDMRAQIAQVTSTDIHKQGVDKATAITPPSPKISTRQNGPNMTAIERRIQRAKRAMRESLAITESWFQSAEPSSTISSNNISRISKWRDDTADHSFSRQSESIPYARQSFSTLPSDLYDDTTHSTTNHMARTSRVCLHSNVV